MADSEVKKDAPTEESSAAPSGRRRLLLGGAALALTGIGGGAGYWFWWRTPAQPEPEPIPPLQFLTLEPPFVTNLAGADAQRLLQVEVSVVTRSPHTLAILKDHQPMLRDGLLMLFASQEVGAVSLTAGKEALRRAALSTGRQVVKQVEGDPVTVLNVLFNGFVVQ